MQRTYVIAAIIQEEELKLLGTVHMKYCMLRDYAKLVISLNTRRKNNKNC